MLAITFMSISSLSSRSN